MEWNMHLPSVNLTNLTNFLKEKGNFTSFSSRKGLLTSVLILMALKALKNSEIQFHSKWKFQMIVWKGVFNIWINCLYPYESTLFLTTQKMWTTEGVMIQCITSFQETLFLDFCMTQTYLLCFSVCWVFFFNTASSLQNSVYYGF